jgi:hypothetical protein
MRLGNEAHHPTCQYHPRKVRRTAAQDQAHRDTLTNLLHGAPASETLLKARDQRNERVRTEIRGNALVAIEKRMAEMKAAAEKKSSDENTLAGGMGVVGEGSRKRKPNLKPAWEEGGLKKKALP